MSDYTLDVAAAKKADQINARIEEKGKYLGVFTRAEPITSKKRTIGVDFSFKSNDGATADYLTIWTKKEDGTQLPGFNQLMAIMTCLRAKSLNATQGSVEKYDREQQKKVTVSTELFKELMGKEVGLLLHMEEYEKTEGGTAWKPAISAPFDSAGFTASEILSQAKSAETLDKMLAALRDRPLKNKPATQSQQHQSGSTGGSFDYLGDDIPF